VLENIALVSAEQSQGIAQINEAINEIDRITQDNLGSVEDTAAAARTLAENASALEAVVGSFKLKHAVSNPSPEPAPRSVGYHALDCLQGAA
jgi:methyl-accepting chemotaxis protein